MCYPCYIKYDFIGRFEHYKKDANHVLNKIIESGSKRSKVTIPFENSSNKKAPLSRTRRGYYAAISRDIVRNLISIYKIDYELFGYDYHWACSDC